MTSSIPAKAAKLLRDFAYSFFDSKFRGNPFNGEPWFNFVQELIKEERFSDFDQYSLKNFILLDLDVDAVLGIADPDIDDKKAVHEKLQNIINTHPREHRYVLQLSTLNPYAGYRIDFSPNVFIHTEPAGYIPHEKKRDRTLNTYLTVRVKGYAEEFGKGSAVDAVESCLKQVAYFLLTDIRVSMGMQRDDPANVLYRGDKRHPVLPVDRLLLQFLGGQAIATSNLWLGGSGLLRTKATTSEEQSASFSEDWMLAKHFFQLPDNLVKRQLGAAIEWLMDSSLDFNDTVAYLKACIGIESILGDPAQRMDELSNRLEDRYAFMTGRDRAEREELGKVFREVLNARGKLVHARQRRLNPSQRHLLEEAKKILSRCIAHELKTLLPEPTPNLGLHIGRSA